MKIFIFLLVLSACATHIPEDVLLKMSENAGKRDKGIDIMITPVEKIK